MMFKWYVTKGMPLQSLLDTTPIERIFLKIAMEDYMKMLDGILEKAGRDI